MAGLDLRLLRGGKQEDQGSSPERRGRVVDPDELGAKLRETVVGASTTRTIEQLRGDTQRMLGRFDEAVRLLNVQGVKN